MTSLELVEFRNTIINYINSKSYPAEIKRMILTDIVKDLEKATASEVNHELESRKDEKEEQE